MQEDETNEEDLNLEENPNHKNPLVNEDDKEEGQEQGSEDSKE